MPDQAMNESNQDLQPIPAVTTDKRQPPSIGASLLKLLVFGAIAFVIWKYGAPLAVKATEALNPVKKSNEKVVITKDSKAPEPVSEEMAKSSVRVTAGYEAWENDIRLELEEWVPEGVAYELISIGVNKKADYMEIRYRTMKDGMTTREKPILLKKDGIDGRYIYTSGDKEFLVYPPKP